MIIPRVLGLTTDTKIKQSIDHGHAIPSMLIGGITWLAMGPCRIKFLFFAIFEKTVRYSLQPEKNNEGIGSLASNGTFVG